jgi:hypothetical protein
LILLCQRRGVRDDAQHRKESEMPEQKTIRRARRAKRQGKSASTQAGEFVREEMHHIRRGKHGARSTKQAIAIGLGKARRAGVKLPRKGRAAARRSPARADRRASPKRSRAVRSALKREGRQAASRTALSRQARQSARRRGPASLKAAAKKAARTKGPAVRKAAARKAAATRKAA